MIVFALVVDFLGLTKGRLASFDRSAGLSLDEFDTLSRLHKDSEMDFLFDFKRIRIFGRI